MAVKAQLAGDTRDLDVLAHHFTTGDPTVGRDALGRYYLTSSRLDGLLDDSERLLEVGTALVDVVNGLGRLHDAQFKPVKLARTFADDIARRQTTILGIAIEISEALPLRLQMNGVPQTPSPSAGDDWRTAVAHPDVAEALSILGKSVDLNWYDLHKVYEIVRENVGGPSAGQAAERLKVQNWVPATDIDGFRHSANTKGISGDAARHARGRQPQTSDKMTLLEGREMISRLVRRWIDSLS